jgi:hypothetical protein
LMRFFLSRLLLLAITGGLSACAPAARAGTAIHNSWDAARNAVWPSSKRKRKSVAVRPLRYAARTATLDVTFGLPVAGVVTLPVDFVPDMSRPPLWLQDGSEVGVTGTRAGKSLMLGFSGAKLAQERVVIEDYGVGAPDGRLLDVVTSANGRKMVTAAALPNRLDVNLVDVSDGGSLQRIASLEGEFETAQLTWLNSGNIALAAQAVAPAGNDSTTQTATVPMSGLYLITIDPSSIRHLDRIKCALSPLAFSPNDGFAVAQGTAGAPPALIDIHGETCARLPFERPLQVLGWAPNSAAFLYRTADRNGVFRFDLQTGHRETIAISSGAAAYASDGTLIALGSRQLSWRTVAAEPMSQIKMQIALFDPRQSLKTLNWLGFYTRPDLLAESTMTFSQASDDAVIDSAIPSASGLVREIIEYSYRARAAFVLAHGTVQGPVTISWAPDAREIAIVDGDATHRTLAVIAPPK